MKDSLMKGRNAKREAIDRALYAMRYAKTFNHAVGACLYTSKGELFSGFNIETSIHKGYHAEEVAIIKALSSKKRPEDFAGIVIAYDFDGVYPCCASCRQMLHEFTNKNLLISVANSAGKVIFEKRLKSLYPIPFPSKRRAYRVIG